MEKKDIAALIAARVPEGKTIDYKESLGDLDSEKGKNEILRDVSSFANTAGGTIYFGIKEERDDKNQPTGFPAAALGLSGFNRDIDVTRILNILATGIEPRVGISPEIIDGEFPNGPVLVLHIHQSWAGPHMIKDGRFFARDDRGKRPMDYHTIRNSFISFLSLNEAVRSFQRERITAIFEGRAPVQLGAASLVVVHALPVSAFVPATTRSIPLEDLRRHTDKFGFVNILRGQANLDGLLVYQKSETHGLAEYVQMFRNGVLERVYVDIAGVEDQEPIVYGDDVVKALNTGIRGCLNTQRELGLEAPVVVTVVVKGVMGCKLVDAKRFVHPRFLQTWQHFDRDVLALPEIICEDLGAPPEGMINELLTVLWQAAGIDEGPPLPAKS